MELINYTEVTADFITYRVNDETTFVFSDDFAADCDDFEDLVASAISSCGGDVTAFQSHMDSLRSLVKSGECVVNWITCESEDSRIDLHFSPGSCKCQVHEYVIDDEDEDDD